METVQLNNDVWIMHHEQGVHLRVRNRGEVSMTRKQLQGIACNLKEYSVPTLFTEPDLQTIKKKFADNPEVCAWVDKILQGELKYEDYL